jgi:hypothetical protein
MRLDLLSQLAERLDLALKDRTEERDKRQKERREGSKTEEMERVMVRIGWGLGLNEVQGAGCWG